MSTRHIPLPGLHNLRDLGGYPTPSGETQWRRILRADGLHRMPASSVEQLHALGVRTVIDLRRDNELEAGPNPFRDHPQVRYVNISLFDALALAHATEISATTDGNVLQHLYCLTLAARADALADVLTTIAEADDGMVLFHCSAGKDRTGVIAALLLALAEVSEADIVEDYALTKTQIAPLLERIIDDAQEHGRDLASFMKLLECEPETMRGFLDHLTGRYGNVVDYLISIGLAPATIAKLRARLLAAPPQIEAA